MLSEDELKLGSRMSLTGTSLVVQWIRLHVLNVGDPVSIPGQETRIFLLQQEIPHASANSPHATTKTWCSQTCRTEDRRQIPSKDCPVGQRTTNRSLPRIFLQDGVLHTDPSRGSSCRTEDCTQIPPEDLPVGWRTAHRSLPRIFL